MPIRKANAEWKGNLAKGTGEVTSESGAVKGSYTSGSRFENGEGTNPDELLGAALASCFSMALSHGLAQAGHEPRSVRTEASVHLDKGEDGFAVSRIDLECEADVPGADDETFQKHVREAKEGCPISQALASIEIRAEARLV